MKQHAAQVGSEATHEGELSDEQLEQTAGGVVASSAENKKLRPPSLQWSGTPYSPEEDVVAY